MLGLQFLYLNFLRLPVAFTRAVLVMKVEFQRCCRLEKCTAYPSVPHPSNHELNASWEVHMTERILTLERRLRRTQFILASALVAFVALAAGRSPSLAARGRQNTASARPGDRRCRRAPAIAPRSADA